MAKNLPLKTALRAPRDDKCDHSCSSSTISFNASGHRVRTYRWRYLQLIKDGLIWLTGKRTRVARSTDSLLEPGTVNAARQRNPGIKKVLRFKHIRRSRSARQHERKGSWVDLRKGGRRSSSSSSRRSRNKSASRGRKHAEVFKRENKGRWRSAKCGAFKPRGPNGAGADLGIKKSGKPKPGKCQHDIRPKHREARPKHRAGLVGSVPAKWLENKAVITHYLTSGLKGPKAHWSKDTLVYVTPTASKTQNGPKQDPKHSSSQKPKIILTVIKDSKHCRPTTPSAGLKHGSKHTGPKRGRSKSACSKRGRPKSAGPKHNRSKSAGSRRGIRPADPKCRLVTPADPKCRLVTPADPKCRPVTPASPKCRLVTPADPKCRKVTPASPKCRQVTPASPKCRQVTPASPKCRKVTPASPKCRLVTPSSYRLVTLSGSNSSLEPANSQSTMATPADPNCSPTPAGANCSKPPKTASKPRRSRPQQERMVTRSVSSRQLTRGRISL